MEVQVRRAEKGDVEAILAFGSRVVPAHYTPILGAEAARDQLSWWSWERMGPAVEEGRVYVAVLGHAVVGVCEYGELAGEQVIWKLYLDPQHRGQSLGVKLLGHVIGSLPKGTPGIAVEHFVGNGRAGRFYEREGFNVVRTDPSPADGPPGAAIVWRRRSLG